VREEMSFVRDWLDAAPTQEHHGDEQKEHNGLPGSCEWVLTTAGFQSGKR
jgi:hypothetical protein